MLHKIGHRVRGLIEGLIRVWFVQVRTIRSLVALECEMTRMLHSGMWQPMQSSPVLPTA